MNSELEAWPHCYTAEKLISTILSLPSSLEL